jgi:acyl-CoA thioesterase FadM
MIEYPRDIRLNDIDAAGVIFYGRAFDIAQEAFEFMLKRIDWPIEKVIFHSGDIFPVVHTEAEYLGAIRLGDTVSVFISLFAISNSSFTLLYQFKRDGETLLRVKTVQVSIKKETWKKSPIPQDFRSRITNL